MKKLLTTSIVAIGILTTGVAQQDAHAESQNNTSTQDNHKSTGVKNGIYYTIDKQGNYHHTLDGNWNQSMFDNKEYKSFETDKNGITHYYYFDINDNDYTTAQSHKSIDKHGYSTNIDKNGSATKADKTDNQSLRTHNDDTTPKADNVTEQDNATTDESNNTDNQSPRTHSDDTTSKTDNVTEQDNATTNESNTNDNTSSDNNNTSENTTTASSNWLTKNKKLQEYGQYHSGGAHYGVDYAMEENTPVYSLADGTVVQSSWSNYGGGNQITIKEKNSDYYQWYMHMNKLNVQKGDEVKAGQQIGESGNTGNSTAPHLHFQRMKGGIGNEYSVNPDSYISNNQ
ncbi:M23 family metallopeptidase [Staphylococcus gallinarum]|uniref:lysostaphin n=1 Tax=Staphylococcus gallinarum TaxID=1293 RepID=A0A3A0W036_STAGA|nr:M23 family metallopeptidase [Staphylococcus gallinarum]RIP34976.1 M23 family metallopeptidase [Staphylococcus gallinarum]